MSEQETVIVIVCPDCGEVNNVKIHDRVWQTWTIDPSGPEEWGDSNVHWDTTESEEMTCPSCDHVYFKHEMDQVLRIFTGLTPAHRVPTITKLHDQATEDDLTRQLEQSLLLVELRNIVAQLSKIAVELHDIRATIRLTIN